MRKRPVPFVPMGGLYEADDVEAVDAVLGQACDPDGNFFPLPEENAFQDAFARHEGAARAIAVSASSRATSSIATVPEPLSLAPG